MSLTAYEYAARMFEPRARRYRSPGALALALDPDTQTSQALDAIDAALVELTLGTGGYNALEVLMPPQEGKSQRVSRRFPEWLLDHDPALRVAEVSYELDMALRWGRDVRQDIALHPCASGQGTSCEAPECRGLHIAIRSDSSAAGRWETPAGGGMYCVGVGGPLTGRPVDVLIIDDPVKDRSAAESPTIRNTTWDWWESVALTRLAPGGKVVLIQCMTGDTPILMGDGTEKPLRGVRPGDAVATYGHDSVTTATVRNWANQGPDFVYRIRTRSGRTVRANARHPFLTVDENGAESWQRTDMLKPGSRIRLVTGANGGVSPVPSVTSQPNALAVTARGCACPTTASRGGAAEYARRLSTPRRAGPRTSATATASMWPTMTGSSRSRPASALSALTPPGAAGRNLTTRGSVSTTTTRPGVSEGCSAIAATLPLDTSGPRKRCSQQLSTYSVGCDEVAEITPAGFEDVFDIEVERTHTFIANGLATHNTRWHEDDLAGRIETRPSPLRWRTLIIPAIATEDDPLGRVPGEELTSVRHRAPGHFYNLRAGLSPYVFSGVYQQAPTAPEGNLFRRAAFRYWHRDLSRPGWWVQMEDGRTFDLYDPVVWKFATVDVAASTKTSADWTVCSVWAINREADLILLDCARERVEMADHFALVKPLRDKWRFDLCYVERQFYSKTLVADARAEGIPVAEVVADTDKVTRAIPAAGRVHAGKVAFPEGAPWLDVWCDELASFPRGAHDDQVDTLSYAARILAAHWTPAPAPPRPARPAIEADQIERAYAAATGTGNGHPPDLMALPLG